MGLAQRKISHVPSTPGWRSPSAILFESLEKCERLAHGGEEWARRHMMAWEFSDGGNDTGPRRTEGILRDNIMAWARYGEQHWLAYGSIISEDGVLGPAWKVMGEALRTLLNGELGRLDGGTLDALLLDIAATCGVKLGE